MTIKKASLLILETVPATPHFETAIDFANRASRSGISVHYHSLLKVLPVLDWHGPIGGDPNSGRSLVDWTYYARSRLEKSVYFCEAELPHPDAVLESRNSELAPTFSRMANTFLKELIPDRSSFDAEQLAALENLFFESSVLTFAISKAIIVATGATDLLIFNGRTPSTSPQVFAADKLNVRKIIHERGSSNCKYSLTLDLPSKVETFATLIESYSKHTPELVKEILASEYYDKIWRGRRPGPEWMNFNVFQSRYIPSTQELCSPQIETLSNDCTFFVSSLDELEMVPNYDFSVGWHSQFDALEALADICHAKKYCLTVRCHPAQRRKPKELEMLRSRLTGYGSIDLVLPEDARNSVDLGLSSRWAFTYVSSIAWELGFLGKPVAIMGKSLGHGKFGVPEVGDRTLIEAYLQDKFCFDRSFSINYGYFMSQFGYTFSDFKATQGLVDRDRKMYEFRG